MQRVINVVALSALLTLSVALTGAFSQGAEQPMAQETEMQWVWGEVVSVDPQAANLTVKYIDYDTDAQKEMTLRVNENTTYENVGSLAEIKPQDSISIDYELAADGSPMARTISIESVPENDLMQDDQLPEKNFPDQVQEESAGANNI